MNLIIGTVGVLAIFVMVFVVQYTCENMTFKQALTSSITIMCAAILLSFVFVVCTVDIDDAFKIVNNTTK